MIKLQSPFGGTRLVLYSKASVLSVFSVMLRSSVQIEYSFLPTLPSSADIEYVFLISVLNCLINCRAIKWLQVL